jgi:hypothetical protein
MDPLFDPRLATWYLSPEVYEKAYRGSVPPSDYFSGNRQIRPMVEPELSGMSRIYREFSASPNEMPVGPWQEGKPFNPLKEAPRSVQRPPNFPLELLKQVPGSPTATGVGMGMVASNLIPILMMLQGSTDPNIARWREERAMATPPDQARSMPDMLMALQQLQQGQPKQPMDPNGMAMMTQEWKTMPKGQPAQPPADLSKIQELMDMIYQRKGRD